MSGRQRLAILIGLTISVVFLLIAFNGLDPAEAIGYLREANPLLIAAAAVWYFSAVVVISMRWGFLLRSIRRVPPARLIELVCIGYMGNNIYPLRAGEILRIALLKRDHDVPIASAGTVVITERIFDGLVMLSFILASIAVFNVPVAPELRQASLLVGLPFVVALVVFLALATRPNALRWLARTFSRPLPERLRALALKIAEGIINGLEALRTPADLAGTVVTSYLSWMLEASVYYLVALAFGLGIDYPSALLVVGVVNLAGLIPASPGQFGVYEYFVSRVLIGIGIEASRATAYALTVHLVIWLPVTIVGFVLLARKGLGWNAIANARTFEQTVESTP